MTLTKEQWLERMRGERGLIMAAMEGATEAELHEAPAGRWPVAGVLRHLMDFEVHLLAGIANLKTGQLPEWTKITDWRAQNEQQAAQWASKPIGAIGQAFVAHRAALEAQIQALTDEQWADPRFARYACLPAYVHDFEHLPGILERLARTRGDQREGWVRYAEIGRNEILALVNRLPEEAFDERVEGKWSIKEILLHLAGRDRHWAKVLRAVSNGQPEEAPLSPEAQAEWNRANVAAVAHIPVSRALYEVGEARGLWAGSMLNIPEAAAGSESLERWARRRLEHDRHHLPQIVERYRSWLKRTQG